MSKFHRFLFLLFGLMPVAASAQVTSNLATSNACINQYGTIPIADIVLTETNFNDLDIDDPDGTETIILDAGDGMFLTGVGTVVVESSGGSLTGTINVGPVQIYITLTETSDDHLTEINSITIAGIVYNTPYPSEQISFIQDEISLPGLSAVAYISGQSAQTPNVSGSSSVCEGATEFYSTDAGKTNYTWSAPGTILSGSSTELMELELTTLGGGNVEVQYEDEYGCLSQLGSLPITVNGHTVNISGPSIICGGSTSTYTTESDNSDYQWNVTGGTITNGGSNVDNFADVSWDPAGGTGTVSVIYTNIEGCSPVLPGSYNVSVITQPTPLIIGNATVCAGAATTEFYSVEAGHTSYAWNISSEGSIVSGAGTETIEVQWNFSGEATVEVSYTDAVSGCQTEVSIFNVTVNSTLNGYFGGGPQFICGNSTPLAIDLEANLTTFYGSPRPATFEWSVTLDDPALSGQTVGLQTSSTITDALYNNSTEAKTIVYTIVAITPEGCRGTPYNAAFSIQPPGVVSAGTDAQICPGDPYTLSQATIGGGATEASWSIVAQPIGGDGSVDNIEATATPEQIVFNAAVPGTYQLQLTTNDPDGVGPCNPVYDEILITIAAPVSAGPDNSTTICNDASIDLSTLLTGASPNGNWTQTIGPGINAETGVVDFSGATNGTYGFDYTVGTCSPDVASITVTVNAVPILEITNAGQKINSGEFTNLLLSTANGVPATTFSWVVDPEPDVTGQADGAGPSIIQQLVTTSKFDNIIGYNITPQANGCVGSTTFAQVTVRGLPIDSLALVALYNSTNGAGWTTSTNWLTGEVDTWHGVIYDKGLLASISLPANNLTGTIPSELGTLDIQIIDLSNNNLTGSIPTSLGDIGLLNTLNLSSNQLDGSIPAELGNTSLRNLNLSNNLLSGPIPNEILTFDLDNLILHHNQLSGPVPGQLGVLEGLANLELQNNEFTFIPNLTALGGANINISENKLTFESLEPNVNISGIILSPQNSFASGSTQNLFVGDPFNATFSVGGTNNSYQWTKDNVDIAGATSETFSIPSVTESDAGIYVLEVENSIVPGVTLTSAATILNVTTPVDPNIALDSLALVAIYNATNGPSWTNNSNWLVGSTTTWHGITTENGRVTSIALSNNNLTGVIPSDISQLTSLSALIIDQNSITSIADLSGLSLALLDVSNNQLEFDDLEPLMSVTASPIVGPQKNFETTTNVDLIEGQALNLIANIGGGSNQYQWQKDGVDISGATSKNLAIPVTILSDAGTYTLNVTNTTVTGVTLTSNPFNVNITAATSLSDSTALVAIYNATNGSGWSSSTNWLTGNLNTWQGVTITNGRVTSLDLSNNNLQGAFPADLTTLNALTSLSLNDNALTSIPPMNALTSLNQVNVSNNILGFNDLESIEQLGIATKVLGPQKNFGTASSTTVFTGQPFVLSFAVGGTNNVYQWQKDGVDVPGATNLNYGSASSQPGDEGVYTLNISNTLVTGFTITSNAITLTINDATNAADSLALVNVYNATNGATWTNSTNWLSGNVNTWHGISVSSGRVVEINLPSNNLTGSLPDISPLSALTTFVVNNNALTSISDLSTLSTLTTINVSDNNLEFDDLEPLASLGIASATFGPQKTYGSASSQTVVAGDPFSLTFTVPGTANTYQWKKNGVDVPGATSDIYSIATSTPTDAGDYTLQVSNTVVTGVVITSNAITIDVESNNSTLTSDSLALVALYNATNGPGWTSSTNWLTGSVNTWYGVTVVSSRVTALNLATNGLTGTLPTISDLTALTSLILSSNSLTSISDLSTLTALVSVNVSGNRLEFDDLEPLNALPIPTKIFEPQQPFGFASSQSVVLGQLLSIVTTPPGTANLYQWQKDGFDIPGATSTTFTKPTSTLSDEGSYSVQVTNTLVPGVTLISAPLLVNVDEATLASDSLALVALYQATAGGNWTTNTNWLSSNVNSWYGVTVTNRRVTGITLPSNKLDGTIPDEFYSLNNLLSLDLSTNQITGSISPQILNLTKLQILRLNNLPMTGPIPTEVFGLADLKTLALSGKINGGLSKTISNITGLTEFSCDSCAITVLPIEITTLSSLKSISLFNNNLTTLPDLTTLPLTALNVGKNKLTFESLETNISISNFTYLEQDSVGAKTSVTIPTETPFVISKSVGGVNNLYQWKKNDITISGATTDEYTINSPLFSDEGFYSLEITNSVVPNLTLFTRPVRIKVSSLKRDSLSLVKIYETTGGENWVRKDGWFTDPNLDNWFGVNATPSLVFEIDLSNNNLTGDVPAELTDMLNLTSVNLSGNQIRSIADVSSLKGLTSLNVSGNQLDFSSLEANVSLFDIMNYSGQTLPGSFKPDSIASGSSKEIKVAIGGENNLYQWKLNDVNIPSATLDTYMISDINRANMGTYTCTITNSLVPGLTLTSPAQIVWATSELSGRLLENATTPITNGIVRLFKVTDAKGYDSIAVRSVNANGEYKFGKVVLDDYQILGFPDPIAYPNALPTYYEKTIFWEEATVLAVNESYSNLDIIAEARPGSGPVGNGIIRGIVEEEDGTGGGRTKAKKAVSGAGVSVRKVENTGRGKEEILTLISYVFTGEDGTFEFDKLPAATYRLNIQYPGYPMDPNSFVNIPIGTGLQSDVSVTALVEPEGVITVSKIIVTELWSSEELIVHVYPNPTRDFIHLNFESPSGTRKISLTDLSGKKVNEIISRENTVVIDVRNHPTGSYILNISDHGMVTKSFHVVFE